jgi:hypothetical protein
MKTPNNVRSGGNPASRAEPHGAGVRPNVTKTFEHRYERRKIREQLRRLDWVLDGRDEIFA